MTRTQKKEQIMANQDQYRAVVADLMKQRNELQFRITEIDAALSALRRIMPDEQIAPSMPRQTSLPVVVNGKYSGMSVRWGILNLLAEDATDRMTTGEIATALQAGGITTTGKNFPANTSAVLSDMSRVKGEVESNSEGWALTAKGRDAWIAAKALRERQQLSSNVHQPLSVQ
jgi:hypothetical protein